jgi:putative SOS response-associated peptidase YedK
MHRRAGADEIRALVLELEKLEQELLPLYHANGFAHPKLLVFTDKAPFQPMMFKWGLIPSWVKDKPTSIKLARQTLNARIETLFELPSFRSSAKNKRCLIYLDAFYEHHHAQGKVYPFHIAMKNEEPLAVAGIWEEWVDKETGEVINTTSIVTTKANSLLGKIHNNPKAEEPRMPVILPKEKQDLWLTPYKDGTTKQDLISLAVPFPTEELVAYPVKRIRGKEALGNIPEAEEKFEYPELELQL